MLVPFLVMNILTLTAIAACLSGVLSAMIADLWLTERISIIGSFIGLQYSLNPGIAWGIRLPPGIQEILIGIALIMVGWYAFHALHERPSYQLPATSYQLSAISYGLILGGGFANIIDRLRDGVVTDYFQIGSFPIFNVADACVTIGVLLLLLGYMGRE